MISSVLALRATVGGTIAAAAVLYLLPHLSASRAGRPDVFRPHSDELYYDAVIARAARTGELRFDLAAGADPTLRSFYPALPLRVAAAAARFGGGPTGGALLFRAVQAVTFATAMFLLAWALGARCRWAVLLVALALFDPFAPFSKPGMAVPAVLLGAGPPGGHWGHFWSRAVSPAWFAVPGLAALAAMTWLLRGPSLYRAAVAAFVTGAASYTALFVSLPVAGGTATVIGVLLWTRQRRLAMVFGVTAGLLAAPQIVKVLRLVGGASFESMAVRFGQRMGANLESLEVVGLWAAAAAMTVVLWTQRHRLPVFLPAAAAAAAGWLLSMQSLITARDFQDFHFLYVPAMVLPAVIAGAAGDLASRAGIGAGLQRGLTILGVAYVCATWFAGAYLQQQAVRIGSHRPNDGRTAENAEAMRWLADHSGPDDVVLAPGNWSWSLAFHTKASPIVDYHAVATFVPDSVLFQRWVYLWKAYRLSREQVRDSLKAVVTQQVPWWPFGFPFIGALDSLGLADYGGKSVEPLAHWWSQLYQTRSPSAPSHPSLAVSHTTARLDYALLGWAEVDTVFTSSDGHWVVARAR